MKYIITETQLKFLIKEQQGVIKLNLEKDADNTKLNNYCKPVLIDKKLLDSFIPKVDSELNEWFAYFKKDYEKKYPEISDYLLDIEKILSSVKPIMSSSLKKTLYTKYGYLNYNDKDDMNLIFKKIYEALDNALQSNFVKKMAIKAFVTKKNVGMVKEGAEQFFREFNRVMVKLRYQIPIFMAGDIRREHKKNAPKCTNLLVTNNEYGDKVTPYNPVHPPLVKDIDYVELDTLLNPYIVQVNKIIDSFV